MGMFDSITCEYKLPLPDDQGELAGHNWGKVDFQTKSLGNLLNHYIIAKDGQLWESVLRYERSKDSDSLMKGCQAELERFLYHGEINFYDFHYGESCDYDVEFRGTFSQGKVVKMELVQWKVRDNAERLKLEKQWKKEEEERLKTQQTVLWKVYRIVWDAPWRKAFWYYRKLLRWLTSSEYRLEKKIRFWSFK
tara:strand:- start:316 stop:894 length:579 start_codon:yes stop_codon:yes gene_type:complete